VEHAKYFLAQIVAHWGFLMKTLPPLQKKLALNNWFMITRMKNIGLFHQNEIMRLLPNITKTYCAKENYQRKNQHKNKDHKGNISSVQYPIRKINVSKHSFSG
jgi:hypothetical protein